MKCYKDLARFIKRNRERIDWADYFMLDGRIFNIYEYGGGSMFHMDYDYVYFVNRRTKDAVYVKYDCPSYQWRDGEKVLTKPYRFIEAEYIPDLILWRPIV